MSKLVRMYPIQTDKFSEVRILEKCPSYVDPFRISFFCNFYNSRTIFFLPPINFGNTSKPFQYVSFRQWSFLLIHFKYLSALSGGSVITTDIILLFLRKFKVSLSLFSKASKSVL